MHLNAHDRPYLTQCRVETSAAPDAVTVIACFDPAQYTIALFDQWGIVQPVGLERMAQRRQAHFLAGRMVAARGLAALGETELQCERGQAGQPVWPTGTSGSISHTDGLCGAIVCRDPVRLCGLDIERIAHEGAVKAIIAKCLSPSEAAMLARSHTLPRSTAATALFSAKETLFKALYGQVQRFFGFNAAEAIEPPESDRVIMRLTQDLAEKLPADRTFEISLSIRDGYVVSSLVTCA